MFCRQNDTSHFFLSFYHHHHHLACCFSSFLFFLFKCDKNMAYGYTQRNKHSMRENVYDNNTEHSSTKCSRCCVLLTDCALKTQRIMFCIQEKKTWTNTSNNNQKKTWFGKNHLTNKTVNIHHRAELNFLFLIREHHVHTKRYR